MIGAILLGAAVVWTMVSAAGRDDVRPWSVAVLLLAAGAAFVVGRLSAPRAGVALPAGLALATALGLLFSPGALGGGPLSPPLGYANANGALAVQGVVAAGMAMAACRSSHQRFVLLGLAGVLAAQALLTRSASAGILALATLTAIGALALRGGPRLAKTVVVIAAATWVVSLGTVLYAAAVWASGGIPDIAVQMLSDRRPHLWHDALVEVQRVPWRGVGPGRFADFSALASSDPDARWAHSGLLQQAAEQGVIGGLLLFALGAWTFTALAKGRRGMVAAIAATGLAALGIQVSVDYLLHFWPLVLFAAALVGLGSSRVVNPSFQTHRRRERESRD